MCEYVKINIFLVDIQSNRRHDEIQSTMCDQVFIQKHGEAKQTNISKHNE